MAPFIDNHNNALKRRRIMHLITWSFLSRHVCCLQSSRRHTTPTYLRGNV